MHFHFALYASARVVKATGSRLRTMSGRQAISVTPTAITRIKELVGMKPGAKALKVAVQQRGCNGFTYTLEYADKKGKFDEEVSQDGATLWIDSKAQLTLIGSEMDFVKSKLAAEFVFHNPNIKSTCGCGESFNMDTQAGTSIQLDSPTNEEQSNRSQTKKK